MPEERAKMDRRTFIRGGTLATLMAGMAHGLPSSAQPADQAPDTKKILNYKPEMKYRRVGNTEMYFSVMGLGGGVVSEPVYSYAIDLGVNLVHTCINYENGQSTKNLGKVLKGRRDKVYVAIKDEFRHIDDALKLLDTDYVDFLMFNRHGRSAASEPKILDALERYRQKGKVRFGGLTSHGDVRNATAAGIQSGMYTVVMPIINQANFEAMEEVLRTAQEKGVGVIAIKGAFGIDDVNLQLPFVKKLWHSPAVTTFMKIMRSFNMVDAYRKALWETLTTAEEEALNRYARENRASMCMTCDECKRACPLGMEISTVLRCKEYYYRQLGDVHRACLTYHSIPVEKRGTPECAVCRKCERVCANEIKIVERLDAARALFADLVPLGSGAGLRSGDEDVRKGA